MRTKRTTPNDRLGAALKFATKRKPGPKGPHKGMFTSKRGSILSRAYWATQRSIPTETMRIHKDAKELAHAAWKKSDERIMECSQAIRERAKKRLGMELT